MQYILKNTEYAQKIISNLRQKLKNQLNAMLYLITFIIVFKLAYNWNGKPVRDERTVQAYCAKRIV